MVRVEQYIPDYARKRMESNEMFLLFWRGRKRLEKPGSWA